MGPLFRKGPNPAQQVWGVRVLLKFLQWCGRVANGLGLPGFVRDCEYRSDLTGAHVTVRRSELYTIITINGLDVYFQRCSGAIDGVGFHPQS